MCIRDRSSRVPVSTPSISDSDRDWGSSRRQTSDGSAIDEELVSAEVNRAASVDIDVASSVPMLHVDGQEARPTAYEFAFCCSLNAFLTSFNAVLAASYFGSAAMALS